MRVSDKERTREEGESERERKKEWGKWFTSIKKLEWENTKE